MAHGAMTSSRFPVHRRTEMREEVIAASAMTLHLLGAMPAICERTVARATVLDFSNRQNKFWLQS